jgi:small ligand-binding sensory domain FIST
MPPDSRESLFKADIDMPYAASFSSNADPREATKEICRDCLGQLTQAKPDLVLVFISPTHTASFSTVIESVREQTQCRHLLACTGETIVGGAREIETGPAISLWCAVLPGARIETFHITYEQTPDGPICEGLPEPRGDADLRAILMLADPFTCAANHLIDRLDDDFPGVPLLGGMASGGTGPATNRLAVDGTVHESGGVGAIIAGGPLVRSVVSQGCRPIGGSFVVTAADRNVMLGLGGMPALARLEETYASLSEEDRKLIRHGLHVGVAMDERKEAFGRGDFLIANVLGADRGTGAVAIGAMIRTGQTVQFHVRDAETADEDLRELLSLLPSPAAAGTRGALLFSCNGRGTRMFPAPDHDAAAIQKLCGPLPLAGFFAQGELGPVAGRNYIHGFTASVALFDDGPTPS